MKLLTLGGLALEGSALSRPSLLLLLAYLALEGPQARRHLAQLFWPGTDRGLRNLSMTLARINKGTPGGVEAGETRIATCLTTDYQEVLELLSQKNLARALELYRGPFLEGLRPQGGVELEEWIYERRESLAAELRQVLLGEAENTASKGRFEEASGYAERAFKLAGAPALEPEDLARLHAFLLAGGSRYAVELAREAKELNLPLPRTPEQAREGLQKVPAAPSNLPFRDTVLIGRERELAEISNLFSRCRLLTLVGPAGVGKTSLALEAAREERGRFRDGVFFVELAPLQDSRLVASSIVQGLGVTQNPAVPILESLREFLHDKHLLLVLDNFEHLIAAAPVVGELLKGSLFLKVFVTSRAPLHLSSEREYPVSPLALPDPGHLPPLGRLLDYPAVALFVERAQAIKPDFSLSQENAKAVAEICARLDGLPLALELAAARIKLFSPQALLGRLVGVNGRTLRSNLRTSPLQLLKGGAQDKPARHQTLREAIAWSYGLLNSDEQSFFRRSAVFVGGFTLEAAEKVSKFEEPLDVVAALVDKSLLRPDGNARFYMLETIREYGLECLTRSGELAATQEAHARCFLALAERAEPELTGPQQETWLDALEAEHDNLRLALAWAQTQEEEEIGMRLGAALWRFWVVRGYMGEGRGHLERLLSKERKTITAPRAKALNGLGTLIFEMGGFGDARSAFEEALEAWRELDDNLQVATVLNNLGWITMQLGDVARGRLLSEQALALNQTSKNRRGEAVSLTNLGNLAIYQARFKQARTLFEESLTLRRGLKDQRGTAYALANLAWAERYLGRCPEAALLLEEALSMLRRLNDKQLVAWALWQQGNLAFDRGEGERAMALLEECLGLHREVGNGEGIAETLTSLADVMREQGKRERAARLLAEALALWQDVLFAWGLAGTLWSQGQLALDEGDDERALAYLRESLSLREKIGDEHGIAECLEGFARVALRQNLVEAARFLGLASALRERLEAPLPPRCRDEYEMSLAATRRALGDQAFGEAWQQGRAMTPEQAVAHILEVVQGG